MQAQGFGTSKPLDRMPTTARIIDEQLPQPVFILDDGNMN